MKVEVAVSVTVTVRGALGVPDGLLLGLPGKVNALISTMFVKPSWSESSFSMAVVNSRPLMYQRCAANVYQKNRRTHCETIRLVWHIWQGQDRMARGTSYPRQVGVLAGGNEPTQVSKAPQWP